MLREQVELEIHPRSGTHRFQRRHLVGVGDDPENEAVLVQLRHRETDAVDADRSFVDDERGEFARQGDGKTVVLPDALVIEHFGASVDVPLDEMAAEPVADAQGALQVDRCARGEGSQIGETQGFVEQIEAHRPILHFRHGEAGAVVRNALAQRDLVGEGSLHPQRRPGRDRFQRDDLSASFDDACEHGPGYGGRRGKDRENFPGRKLSARFRVDGKSACPHASPMHGTDPTRFAARFPLPFLLALLLLATAAQADIAPPKPPPSTDIAAGGSHLPGVALAEGITQITGVAISPLLGVCGVGAWEYFTSAPAERPALPWFCHPLAWGIGFGILSLVLAKDLFGTALPAVLKKPLDVVELFEDKLSAIVASAALVPFLDRQIAEHFATSDPAIAFSALAAPGLAAIQPALAQSPVWLLALFLPLSLIAFFAVWLSSHALNVLLLFSPFGLLDLLLKAARLLFLAGLVLLSAVAPVLAGILCLLLVLVALWFAPRAFRLCVFGTVMSTDLLRSLVRQSDRHERTRGFLARSRGSLAPLSFGALERGDEGAVVFKSRFLFAGPQRIRTLAQSADLQLEKGFVFPSLRERDPATGRTAALLHLLPRHRQDLLHVARTLGLEIVDPPVVRGARAAMRRLRESFSPTRPEIGTEAT